MDAYRVKPGQKIDLDQWDPDDKRFFDGDKDDGEKMVEKLSQDLEPLQELLYAEHKRRILVVLQGMDTSGKDGVIRHVFSNANPQGLRVASFKVPTPIELDHDYLWRIHQQTPGKGEIVIFNRSHYEDVLVVRVHNIVPEAVWQKRYAQINAFEQTLAEEGTLILKFFLHISKKEQKERLIERIDVPEKNWKFNPGDLKERELWKDYQSAYETVLNRTSTEFAPWYIVPSDRKWYRNLVISTVLIDTLKKLNMKYPAAVENIQQYRAQLAAQED